MEPLRLNKSVKAYIFLILVAFSTTTYGEIELLGELSIEIRNFQNEGLFGQKKVTHPTLSLQNSTLSLKEERTSFPSNQNLEKTLKTMNGILKTYKSFNGRMWAKITKQRSVLGRISGA